MTVMDFDATLQPHSAGDLSAALTQRRERLVFRALTTSATILLFHILTGSGPLLPLLFLALALAGLELLMFSADTDALRQARTSTAQANRAVSEYLTLISHDIRTPLNGMMGMAQSLAHDPLTESQRDRLETLIRSGRGLQVMIAEGLAPPRMNTGQEPVSRVAFDLRALVQTAVDPFLADAATRPLRISQTLSPGLAGAYRGDPVGIRQCLQALISHAMSRMPTGEILISASPDVDGIRLSVSDSVPVTPDDLAAGPCGRRARTGAMTDLDHSSRSAEDSLWRAHDRVQALQGALIATARVPTGLCLTAVIPLTPAGVPPAATPSDPVPVEPSSGLRVLVAEDHPVNRKVLALLLEQIGIHPTLVSDGLEAVTACRTRRWDIVLMDIQMPRLDGIAAARQIWAEAVAEGRPCPPIVAVTANVLPRQLRDYADAGMPFCVSKPVEAETLFSVMNLAMDAAKSAADAQRSGTLP
ncbi:response regulator [Rhizobium sp. CRIBSB]|nr:response regulator [Rhizobium sp. CRIBSB]